MSLLLHVCQPKCGVRGTKRIATLTEALHGFAKSFGIFFSVERTRRFHRSLNLSIGSSHCKKVSATICPNYSTHGQVNACCSATIREMCLQTVVCTPPTFKTMMVQNQSCSLFGSRVNAETSQIFHTLLIFLWNESHNTQTAAGATHKILPECTEIERCPNRCPCMRRAWLVIKEAGNARL